MLLTFSLLRGSPLMSKIYECERVEVTSVLGPSPFARTGQTNWPVLTNAVHQCCRSESHLGSN